MYTKVKKLRRIPFEFFHDCVLNVNGVSYHFGSLSISGWVKRKGRKWQADVDKVFNNNDNIKDKLECEDGMEQIEQAADHHTKQLLRQLNY